MNTAYVADNGGTFCFGTRGETVIRCKLFSDEVTVGLCEIRKRELDKRGAFSCLGCAHEKRIMSREPEASR